MTSRKVRVGVSSSHEVRGEPEPVGGMEHLGGCWKRLLHLGGHLRGRGCLISEAVGRPSSSS